MRQTALIMKNTNGTFLTLKKMSVTSFLIRLLDRRGCRIFLGLLSTFYFRQKLGLDVEIKYKTIWTHRVGKYFFPDGHKFTYNLSTVLQLVRHNSQRRIESNDYWFPFYRPSRGDVVIDVGAGRGEDLPAFLDAVGKTGKVIAIEAHPRSFAALRIFCEINKLRNVTTLHVATMSQPGIVELTDLDDWESNAVGCATGSNSFRVRADTLDNICDAERIDQIGLLKMNIEGAERFALLGMNRIANRCKAVCIACHDFRADRGESEHFRTRLFVERYLEERGFQTMSRRTDSRDYVRDHVFGLK